MLVTTDEGGGVGRVGLEKKKKKTKTIDSAQ